MVRIPTPLRSYTGGAAVVEADGTTLAELLDDLDRRHPGLRFRAVDEQGQLRQHMRIFVNRELERDLERPVGSDDDVAIMQALSGGCNRAPSSTVTSAASVAGAAGPFVSASLPHAAATRPSATPVAANRIVEGDIGSSPGSGPDDARARNVGTACGVLR